MSTSEREKEFTRLRCLGDFYHNMKVLKTGGELMIVRRPAPDDVVVYTDYVPCTFCLGFITVAEMWRHIKTCSLREESPSSNNKNLIEHSKVIIHANKYAKTVTAELTVILESMMKDQITEVVQKDELICAYGSFLLSSRGLKRSNFISQRMRILARLLLKVKETNDVGTLTKLIDPKHFDLVIEATKQLGGFSLETEDGEQVPSFSTPSLPLKIGYSLEKCAFLLEGNNQIFLTFYFSIKRNSRETLKVGLRGSAGLKNW